MTVKKIGSGTEKPEFSDADLRGGYGLTGDYHAQLYPRDSPVQVTERLVLRPPHSEDVEPLMQLANNRNIAKMLSRLPYPYRREHAESFIERSAAGAIGPLAYAVTLAESGAFIGCCSLHDHTYGAGYEIGYWLGEPYWGQGYATEMMAALIDVAFRSLSYDQLHISCQSRNFASKRVIEKSGFQYVGDVVTCSGTDGDVPAERFVLTQQGWLDLRGAGK